MSNTFGLQIQEHKIPMPVLLDGNIIGYIRCKPYGKLRLWRFETIEGAKCWYGKCSHTDFDTVVAYIKDTVTGYRLLLAREVLDA